MRDVFYRGRRRKSMSDVSKSATKIIFNHFADLSKRKRDQKISNWKHNENVYQSNQEFCYIFACISCLVPFFDDLHPKLRSLVKACYPSARSGSEEEILGDVQEILEMTAKLRKDFDQRHGELKNLLNPTFNIGFASSFLESIRPYWILGDGKLGDMQVDYNASTHMTVLPRYPTLSRYCFVDVPPVDDPIIFTRSNPQLKEQLDNYVKKRFRQFILDQVKRFEPIKTTDAAKVKETYEEPELEQEGTLVLKSVCVGIDAKKTDLEVEFKPLHYLSVRNISDNDEIDLKWFDSSMTENDFSDKKIEDIAENLENMVSGSSTFDKTFYISEVIFFAERPSKTQKNQEGEDQKGINSIENLQKELQSALVDERRARELRDSSLSLSPINTRSRSKPHILQSQR